MAIKLFDRVKQKTLTSGTGIVSLGSSVDSFLDFSSIYSDNDNLFYTIENLTDFEVGIGTYSGNTVSRDTVLKSSNSDNLLNLPGDTNTFIFVTYPASGAVHTSGNRCVVDIDGINFNVGAAPAYTEGRIFYDSANHALAVYNDEPEITLQVGQEEYLRVRNNTSGTIFNGEAVRILGSQGTHVTIDKAIATGDFSAQAIGLATHDIENNSFGYVTTYGVVNDVDTSDFNDGDEIFLSPEISGGLTGVSPIAPNYKLSLGHVVRSHPTVGQIVIKPSTPKLGGGDVKSLGEKVEGGVAFTDILAGSDAAIIASNSGMVYDSGNEKLTVSNLAVGSGDHGDYRVNINTTYTDHNFVIRDSNGRVGINTEILSSDLNIGGGRFIKFAGGNAFIDTDAGGFLNLRAGGTVFLSSDGAGARFFGYDGGGQVNMQTKATARRTLVIEKLAGQTADIVQIRDELDNPYFTLAPDGELTSSGDLNIGGTVYITGNIELNGYMNDASLINFRINNTPIFQIQNTNCEIRGAFLRWAESNGTDRVTASHDGLNRLAIKDFENNNLATAIVGGFENSGYLVKDWETITGDYTLDASSYGTFVSPSGNTLITIPSGEIRTGREFKIKRIVNNGNSVTVTGENATIDNADTQVLSNLESTTLTSDGTNWYIV